MIIKTFSFSRVQKSPAIIEADLNLFLKDYTVKYAVQNESALKGKVIISLFCDEKPGKIKAKVFKDQDIGRVDEVINEFLETNSMKFVTQTFIGSSIYTILFYTGKDSAE